jgi:hypothetical protein
MKLIGAKTIKPRKRRRCFACEEWIEPGSPCRATTWAEDGRAYTIYEHLGCSEISEEFLEWDDEVNRGYLVEEIRNCSREELADAIRRVSHEPDAERLERIWKERQNG